MLNFKSLTNILLRSILVKTAKPLIFTFFVITVLLTQKNVVLATGSYDWAAHGWDLHDGTWYTKAGQIFDLNVSFNPTSPGNVAFSCSNDTNLYPVGGVGLVAFDQGDGVNLDFGWFNAAGSLTDLIPDWDLTVAHEIKVDCSSSTAKFYIDGVQVASTPRSTDTNIGVGWSGNAGLHASDITPNITTLTTDTTVWPESSPTLGNSFDGAGTTFGLFLLSILPHLWLPIGFITALSIGIALFMKYVAEH